MKRENTLMVKRVDFTQNFFPVLYKSKMVFHIQGRTIVHVLSTATLQAFGHMSLRVLSTPT